MKLMLTVLALLPAVALCQFGPYKEECKTDMYPPPQDSKVPWVTINLDDEPSQRWNAIAKKAGPDIQDMINGIKNLFPSFLRPTFLKLVNEKLPAIMEGMPEEYAEEIRGIANATGIPLGEIVLFNVFYEFDAMCTSIVARGADGSLVHARNLDFGLFLGWDFKHNTWTNTEKLRKIIYNIDFQKDGKTAYQTTAFIGYIGVITGYSKNGVSLAANERYQFKGGWYGIYKWVTGDHSGNWLGFATRHALEKSANFTEAKAYLENVKLIAPIYFILGGTGRNDGCVITRSQDKVLEERCLSDTTWYVLETNYDWWKKPLFFDNRRDPAVKCMNKMGTNGNGVSGIFNVLNTKPVLNKLTTYTAVMEVAKGNLESYIRTCPSPCWPW